VAQTKFSISFVLQITNNQTIKNITKMKKVLILFFATAFFCHVSVFAQDPVLGKWKTIDDETGKPKSIVTLIIKKDKSGKEFLYGNIVKLYREPNEDQDPICDKCTDYRKNRKIVGMEIVTNLHRDGKEWAGDNGILDPKKGQLYDCKIWVDPKNPDILNVRGYIGFFYRTQTWLREK